jgi:SAM-dependent methyltransferase
VCHAGCSIVAMAGEQSSLLRVAVRRWRQTAGALGAWRAARELAGDLGYFLRESTPERRRARYGDLDYDFESGADTTAANLSWRTRLRAALSGSPYQPSEPGLFHEMMRALPIEEREFARFTFIDIGSGKGRALLLAAEYPFRRIVGVEIVPELNAAAEANMRKRREQAPTSPPIELWLGDAAEFPLPEGPLVIYLFDPLPEAALAQLVTRLDASLHATPRAMLVVYHNPLLEHVLAKAAAFERCGGTHQYALYRSRV